MRSHPQGRESTKGFVIILASAVGLVAVIWTLAQFFTLSPDPQEDEVDPREVQAAVDLEATARAYIQAVNEADGEAIWTFLTERCRAATSVEEVVANEETAELNSFGDIRSLAAEVEGGTGTVDVRTTKGNADLVRQWVINEGEWRTTRCTYL